MLTISMFYCIPLNSDQRKQISRPNHCSQQTASKCWEVFVEQRLRVPVVHGAPALCLQAPSLSVLFIPCLHHHLTTTSIVYRHWDLLSGSTLDRPISRIISLSSLLLFSSAKTCQCGHEAYKINILVEIVNTY